MLKCKAIACPSFTFLSRATCRDFIQGNIPWLRTCQFVVSPVNYSESDSDSSDIYCWQNLVLNLSIEFRVNAWDWLVIEVG